MCLCVSYWIFYLPCKFHNFFRTIGKITQIYCGVLIWATFYIFIIRQIRLHRETETHKRLEMLQNRIQDSGLKVENGQLVNHDASFVRFDTIPDCDRRKDGCTSLLKQ